MNVTSLSDVPTWTLALMGVLIVFQLVLEIYALVKLFKTPDERLVLGNKWPWVAIIVLVNILGAIIFLAVGRKPAVMAEPAPAASDTARIDRAERAADVLYGSGEGE
ncbi:MAG: hypothetical protein CVT66_00730 [Actinobacteria bacterium HGW-Actinobacteria-6]|jgi:hypothetical protein|nr:MAG: hypothetical protein CVT66_00730 [Actinobacteria bacterium HGW-Actinobacteria-6]